MLQKVSFVALILEAYSVREARIHVRRLRDLLSTSFESSAHNAVDNLSLSFSVAVTGVEVEGKLYFKLSFLQKATPSSILATPSCIVLY